MVWDAHEVGTIEQVEQDVDGDERWDVTILTWDNRNLTITFRSETRATEWCSQILHAHKKVIDVTQAALRQAVGGVAVAGEGDYSL